MVEHWDPFDGLSTEQLRQLEEYERLLVRANRKQNLISRASSEEVHVRHIAHSLMLGRLGFPNDAEVVDWGTGGGLPGIPLAIRFPGTTFHLVDSIYKKTRAIETFRRELGLQNVIVHCTRAEDFATGVDYAVARATAPLTALWEWTRPILRTSMIASANDWGQGLITLKGGDLTDEISDLRRAYRQITVEQTSLEETTGWVEMREKYILSVSERLNV